MKTGVIWSLWPTPVNFPAIAFLPVVVSVCSSRSAPHRAHCCRLLQMLPGHVQTFCLLCDVSLNAYSLGAVLIICHFGRCEINRNKQHFFCSVSHYCILFWQVRGLTDTCLACGIWENPLARPFQTFTKTKLMHRSIITFCPPALWAAQLWP